ncbi:AP endonuclease [Clostridium tetani]|uniref:Endonuclease IV n=1 Tax=Clostridium tetani (strain Massachusetts / E88) TaxID=212717 RepID=Q893R5_CLOTE|nr:TIM barrel protein [Clostridium tetani]AAO36277.1 endonuclease IV [Clostridium tetani E88]AVP54280.1 AP endonuclease [Clostridium tetani]KGI37759.1 AP endonuclease [Clostridium tetani]KGI39685.1 AP endonuclease [Clostridium tetani ATCC 9441]KGI45520.1 AP endonuclease [Clostridium tetani]
MDKLIFGISGLPIGDGNSKFNYKTGIKYLNSIGLEAMELPFVRSVNITEKNKEEVLNAKIENNIYLSAHGSYFINLNAVELEKQEKSMERIIKGADGLKKVEGRSLIFHPGFYLKDTKEKTFNTIKENLKKLPYFGIDYRLETTGKPTQFGSLEEIVALCKDIKHCKPCIDFSHLHARYNGTLKNYDDFANILDYMHKNLGYEALEDMHIHISGIHYGEKGEKNHLPFLESDFNYKDCMKAFKSFDIKGCIICESPVLEKDALLLKEYYYSL